MHPGEYEVMSRVEDDHWWYRGLRDCLERTLRIRDLSPPAGARVLDAGCGTGANLRLLRDLLRPSHLVGFDAADEALALARAKVPEADLYRADICAPEVRSAPLDLIVSLDVIYIPGAQRARDGLRTLVEALRPGGLFVVNLPAYDWLYSEHDVAIHTHERYTAGRVRQLFDDLGLEVALLTYRVCLLFPLVVMTRLPGMLRARPGDPAARSDLHHSPSPQLARALHAVLRAENRLVAAGVRLPWGSSVFAVGRKP